MFYDSLDAIPSWLELLKEEKENPKYIILGNKDDLKNKQISEDEINIFIYLFYLKKYNLLYLNIKS